MWGHGGIIQVFNVDVIVFEFGGVEVADSGGNIDDNGNFVQFEPGIIDGIEGWSEVQIIDDMGGWLADKVTDIRVIGLVSVAAIDFFEEIEVPYSVPDFVF